MGGYIAFAFWAKYAARLRGLVLADTRSAADTPEAAGGRLVMAEKVLKDGVQALKDGMLPKLVAPQSKEQMPETFAKLERMFDTNPPKGIAAALRGMAVRQDWGARLKDIRVPTLVVVGEKDAISTPDEMKKIADGIPGARFVKIEGVGHMSPMENAAKFNAALREFGTGLK
jgi:pimeloyl-ACP methyl ester carboxylesterase